MTPERVSGVSLLAQAAIVVEEVIPTADRALIAFGCNADDLASRGAARRRG
jgi:hypothetical protein